jgi:hypothetical protein
VSNAYPATKSIQQKKEHQEIRRIVGSKLAAYTIFICNAQLIDRVLPFALKTSPTIFTAGVFSAPNYFQNYSKQSEIWEQNVVQIIFFTFGICVGKQRQCTERSLYKNFERAAKARQCTERIERARKRASERFGRDEPGDPRSQPLVSAGFPRRVPCVINRV